MSQTSSASTSSASTSSGGSGGLLGSINPFGAVGAAADALTNFLPQQTEFSGSAGNVAAGLQGAWDGISNAAMAIPPFGTMVGGIMKATNFLGRGLNALGAGTDGMTAVDAVLGSPFFNLTPFGLINGIFGDRADTFTKDNEVFSQMGSAYSGSDSLADLAASKSGKKYGLFSQGARREANTLIHEATRLLNTIRDILEDTNDLNLLAMSMSQINNNAYANRLQGGYLQGLIRAAKLGSILLNKDAIKRAKLFLKKGAKLDSWPKEFLQDKDFVKFLKSCPEKVLNYTENFESLYNTWTSLDKPNDISDTLNLVIPLFTPEYELNLNLLLYYSLPEENDLIDDTSSSTSEDLQSFKEGGQLNVIPEGALHAHKHNLEEINEDLKGNITHKGIPVVSVNEDGSVELLAEVERNELILNLETTNAIEELREQWHNEESPSKRDKLAEEAGKIFAESVMENTDDRTNLMEEV